MPARLGASTRLSCWHWVEYHHWGDLRPWSTTSRRRNAWCSCSVASGGGPAMKAGDIMTTDLVSATPESPCKEVVERLVRSDVSRLPVVNDRGKLVGLITEAD